MVLCSLTYITQAQQEDVDKLQENARTFMAHGDYANATLILTRAFQQEPQNLEIAKNLSMCYLLQNEMQKGIDVIKPFVEKDDADDQAYQIAATIYRKLAQPKDAERMYKKALREFPNSGGLYNDYGEMLLASGSPESIKMWEKGIQMDPSSALDYYNAAKYYYYKKDNLWCIIYGEIFINLESFTARTAEIKDMLLDSYKKFFASPDLLADIKGRNEFEIAYLTCMNKQNDIVIRGMKPETLTMIRTRFILDWFKTYASRFPFRLFDWQKQLLEQGMFPAYNEWIFGASQNLAAYQNWSTTHAEETDAFKKFQASIIFKMPKGQYYH